MVKSMIFQGRALLKQVYSDWHKHNIAQIGFGLTLSGFIPLAPVLANPPRTPDLTETCEILVVGAGLAGVATAYEALLAGRTVCLTDITDWKGGQITAQGTSALDETSKQRSLLFYSRGYRELRDRIQQKYGKLNPGDCWVSASCYIPRDANAILNQMLRQAAKQGKGKLKWFPNTVIKQLQYDQSGNLMTGAIAIQHQPAPGAPPLNTLPLSRTIEEAYRYTTSPQLTKRIIQFVPQAAATKQAGPAPWIVVEATETGELLALADVPYRLGLDPLSAVNPSSPVKLNDPYCTQGFTYTFAMEQTKMPQPQVKPPFYDQYQPYYAYDPNPNKADFNYVFTYRRIWAPTKGARIKAGNLTVNAPEPGHISMQNWTWGNDYRPGTSKDNLIYSREQLEQTGQLTPGDWMGGLRADALRRAEELALGYYYWLVAGDTDSQLGPGVKKPYPNHRLLTGLQSPMGTVHGLSKYPYMREGRRIIGRPSYGRAEGFTINELDISSANYRDSYYQETLPPAMYRQMWLNLAGLQTIPAIAGLIAVDDIDRRARSTLYPDSVGISHYAIDFHPCMTLSPPETPGNTERAGVRQIHGPSYPGQIPLRAMIPQKIDNLLVAGKSIATSYSAAAAYRVHSFEWSSGAAAGTTADFVLQKGILPYQLTQNLPSSNPLLDQLRARLEQNGNPTQFPGTSIFNENWQDWAKW
ncbi:MAG: FAD-dependent oxidoreductase [Leptolyngbyaceae cyanobacterium]